MDLDTVTNDGFKELGGFSTGSVFGSSTGRFAFLSGFGLLF